jgi:ATP-dependent Zn protease
MIVFWIFYVLVPALTTLAYGLLIAHWNPLTALLAAVAVALSMRGVWSLIKRSLVLRERLPDERDLDLRTIETNRAIFWRRVIILAVFVGLPIWLALSSGVSVEELVAFIAQMLLMAVQVLALLLINFLLFFGGFFLYGRIGRQMVMPDDANYEVRIDDVRGQKAAVDEMRRILKLIESGRNFLRAGGQRERGVLMVGPPGTGKTMLAKGIATSLRMPIIITSGASFAGMFLGMDVLNVFMLVRAAKSKAKRWGGCAIFIDEFDALGSRRSGMQGGGGPLGGLGGMFGGGQMGLNMLLVLMDGVDQPGFVRKGIRRLINVSLDGIFLPRKIQVNGSAHGLRLPPIKPPRYNLLFLGATNRPSVLDEAVTRPGRFGRTITFRMPTREDRKDISDLYFDKKKHDPELDSPERRNEFARITAGYSPAMIEQALSLALMYAFEDGRDAFKWPDLRRAMGNIESGLEQPVEYTERERVAVARHEVGHAVALRFFEPDQAPVRLSIRMRADGSLGRHSWSALEEEFTRLRSQMAGRLRTGLGALASERVFYGENSDGVFGDLMQVTSWACHMVGNVGMGPDALPVDLSRKAASFGEALISVAEVTQGMHEQGTNVSATLSNPRARRVVAQVLGAAYIDDWRLMYANREAIDQAAEALALQGELVGDEVTGLLDSVGLRMFDDSTPYPPDLPSIPPDEDVPLRPRIAAAEPA